jgi:hypothetical protein
MQDLRTQLSSKIIITDADRESKKLLRISSTKRTLDNRKRTRVTVPVVRAEHVSDGLAQETCITDEIRLESFMHTAFHYR